MDEQKQFTDIEIIVFEDEDGLDIEMELVDEFDLDGTHYVALRPSLDAADFDADEDSITFFAVIAGADGNEMFDLIEDATLIGRLADRLEERLLLEE